MSPITLALNAGVVVSEKGSPDTKLSPPSSSAAMLSTVTHCWTMSFRMAIMFSLERLTVQARRMQLLGHGQTTGERRTVGGGRAAPAANAAARHAGTPADPESDGAGGHHLCAENRHSLGVLPAGDGLLRHDPLASAGRLAA